MRTSPVLRIFFLLTMAVLTFLLLSSCGNPIEPRCGWVAPAIVPTPAFNSPIWHPSGKFIGFNHIPLVKITYPYGEDCWGEEHFNIDSAGFWLIDSDGTNMRRILPYGLSNPAWSPDGQWIAFCSRPQIGIQIFKMRFTGTTFDTTTLTQLTFEGDNFSPAWSPDGQWIAYSNRDSGIFVMRNDGTSRRFVVRGVDPYWSVDGNSLIYVAGDEIFRVMLSDTSQVVRLTSLKSLKFTNHPRYSPDGTKIVFHAFNSNYGELWMIDSTGANLRQLTTHGVDVTFGLPFSWSPKGDKIVYTRYRPDKWTLDNGVLWLLDLNTGTTSQFTFNP